jgi:hypothetical protein
MDLRDRTNQPDRRADALPVIHERRDSEERRVVTPRWLTWTRENQSRGKSLDSGRAA